MNNDSIITKYHDWLFSMVCDNEHPIYNYDILLDYVNEKEFEYSIFLDKNRASDGLSLRYRYGLLTGKDVNLALSSKQSSIFEVMIALAIRCNEMLNVEDCVPFLFWTMMKSLGLENMTNDIFSKKKVDNVLERFLERRFSYNGKGGLFTIKNPRQDMREIEIWYQMHAYLNELFNE